MWPRYFLARNYLPIPYRVCLPMPDPVSVWSVTDTPVTLHTLVSLRRQVLRHLGDPASSVWTATEIDGYLTQGYQELAATGRTFWDQVYVESLPRGFSSCSVWESQHEAFGYMVANYTYADERRLLDETHRLGSGNHTCPDEATDGWLGSCGASASIPAVTDLPESVLELERVTWDHATIEALSPAMLAKEDTRFQKTEGEVFGYTWRQDGIRAFRKVRVPSAQSDSFAVTGDWGILRNPAEVSGETATGTWGAPRRIPTQHPIGSSVWGIARRVYDDHLSVRVEHWRKGRDLDDPSGSELPSHYARYLRDYALSHAHGRSGPGQDDTLATHYSKRWMRGLARIVARRTLLQRPRTGTLGQAPVLGGGRPPRPQLPWPYPKVRR